MLGNHKKTKNHISSLSKAFFSFYILTNLFILNACGVGNMQGLDIDDQKAVSIAQGRIEGQARSRIDIHQEEQATQERNSTNQKLPPTVKRAPVERLFQNVNSNIDFESNKIQISAERVRGADKIEPLYFEGSFDKEIGFAYMFSADKSTLAVVRCIDKCDKAIIDLVIQQKNKEGQIREVREQFETRGKQGASSVNDSLEKSDNESDSNSEQGISLKDLGFDQEEAPLQEYYTAPIVPIDVYRQFKPESVVTPMSEKQTEKAQSDQKTSDMRSGVSQGQSLSFIESPAVAIYDPSKKDSKEDLFPIMLGDDYSGKAINGYYVKNGIQGKISTSSQIALEGEGFLNNARRSDSDYMAGLTKKYIEEAGKKFQKTSSAEPFRITSVAKKGGGRFGSHKSHQNGLDVDISLFRDAKGKFDNAKNWELIKTYFRLGLIHGFFTDKSRIQELCLYAKSKGEFESNKDIFNKMGDWGGHKDHLHVRISCDEHNPSCIPQETLNYNLCI